MFSVIYIAHIVLCVLLVILVLLQQGKGADAGAAFGGSSNTLFGATGATSLIVKLTTGLAVAFMATSVGLIYLYQHHSASSDGVIDVGSPFKGATSTEAPISVEVPTTTAPAVPSAAAPSEAAESKAPAAPGTASKN